MSIRVLLLMPLTLGAVAQDDPRQFLLRSDTDVWDIAVEDLNADGLKDVLAVTCEEDSDPPVKHVRAYVSYGDVYPSRPSFETRLDDDAGGVFLAEVDGTAPRELVAVSAQGAVVYAYEDGEFAQSASVPFTSLFPTRARLPRFLEDIAHDLDGDGKDEWIVPVSTGFAVIKNGITYATIRGNVQSELSGSGLGVYHRLPRLFIYGEPDPANPRRIALASDAWFEFFSGPTWSARQRLETPLIYPDEWDTEVRIDDANQDGWPDLMVTQTRGTVTLQAQTQVYLATGDGQYPDSPTVTFEAKGAIASPEFVDIDGDGFLDIMVVRVKFGVKNVVNYLIRGKLSADIDVLLFRDGGYDDDPTFSDSVTVDAPDGREEIASTEGDFNGDGRLDIAFSSKRDELSIHTSDLDRFLSRRAWHEFEMPSMGEARTEQLDDNSRDDIVIFHPTMDEAKRIEVIVF